MFSDITIVIPTKNEESCIKSTILEIKKLGLKKIIIADANSTDRTIKIAKNLNCFCFCQKKKGYGQAVTESLSYIKTRYVSFVDADGSYNPKSLLKMYKLIKKKKLDCVLASRYKDGLRSEDDTIIRFIGNMFFTQMLRFLFRTNITDFLFHYILCDSKKYKNLNLKYNSFSLCFEVPIRMKNKNYKFLEIKSKERKRTSGVSKVNAFKDGLIMLKDVILLFYELKIKIR
jgi:glycosyltransferase involved in cell wall biosynthesis